MDYFLISLKPLLFTGWAQVGTMLPLGYCWGPWLLRNFPWTHTFLRVGGQCVFWQELLSPENFLDLCFKEAEPCQYLLGNLMGLRDVRSRPRDGSSSPLSAAPIRAFLLWTILSLTFIWKKKKKGILFLNILDITLILVDSLKFETFPEVLNQDPWVCGLGWEKLYLYVHWSTG